MRLILWLLVISCLCSSCGNGGNNETPSTGVSGVKSEKFALDFPLSCLLWSDCTIAAFPDAGSGKDAFCTKDTYPGHTGTDFASSWERMDKGINVLAAHSGTVLFAFDGKYDRCLPGSAEADCKNPASSLAAGLNEGNTVCSEKGSYCNGSPCYFCASAGNYVVIRHASGNSTLYGHLAKGSVAVKTGETVSRGQTIARLGSSGISSGPHLHIEVLDSSLKPVDPWYGLCNAGLKQALWTDQPSMYSLSKENK